MPLLSRSCCKRLSSRILPARLLSDRAFEHAVEGPQQVVDLLTVRRWADEGGRPSSGRSRLMFPSGVGEVGRRRSFRLRTDSRISLGRRGFEIAHSRRGLGDPRSLHQLLVSEEPPRPSRSAPAHPAADDDEALRPRPDAAGRGPAPSGSHHGWQVGQVGFHRPDPGPRSRTGCSAP